MEYAVNYVYQIENLEFFNHPEGYISFENNGYRYVYQYKDHLGNVRFSYVNDPRNLGTPLIIEENNHDSFGLIKHNQKLFSLENQYRPSDFLKGLSSKCYYFFLTNAAHERIKRILAGSDKIHILIRVFQIGGKEAKPRKIINELLN